MKIKQIIGSRVFKNSIWLTILQFVNTIIPMLSLPYITRILGTEEYGVFSIALNWILYFQVLVEFGFGLSGAKKVATAENDKQVQTTFNNIISSRIILFVISFILMNVVCVISKFNIENYKCMLLLFIMIIGTTFQLTWLFQGKQDMRFITIINSLSRIVSFISIFILVKKPTDIYIYCFLYSITLLLSSIISIVIALKKYKLKFKFSNIKSIKSEINDAKYLFLSSAMTKIFSGFGLTVLGYMTIESIVGIYSAINKIPYILTMFFTPISQALYPYISKKYKENFNEGINSVKKISKYVFIMFLIPVIIIAIFRNIFIKILFGNEYLKYSFIVIPLLIQFIFAMINNFIGIHILVASDNQKLYTKAFSIGCLAILIFNILLGYLWKIYGVGIASPLGEMTLTIALLFELRKLKQKYNKKSN